MDFSNGRLWAAVLVAALLFLGGCGDKLNPYPIPDNGTSGDGGSNCDPTYSGKISYCNQIKTLMNSCTSCHSGGRTAGVDLDTYQNVKNNSAKSNQRIQSGSMPPSGAFTSDQKLQFSTWICDGMPECL
jgi:hypothetical protein